MKKIGFVLGLAFLVQVCSAGKYDSIFESHIKKDVDIYIKYDPVAGFDIKMNGRQTHYDLKKIRNGYYRGNKFISDRTLDYFERQGTVWFEKERDGTSMDVYDVDNNAFVCVVAFNDGAFYIKSSNNTRESSVAIDAPNIVIQKTPVGHSCEFSKFYARVAEGGLFFNERQLIADNTAIFAENGFIYNSGYIGPESKRSEFKCPSRKNCVNVGDFYKSKIWKTMPGYIANVGTMAGQKIDIQDLSLFQVPGKVPGKILCDDITIGDKKYDSKTCPSVEPKPTIDPNLSQRIDRLNQIHKIPDETLNVIKQGYHKRSDGSWELLPYNRFESIIIDQQKRQEISAEDKGGNEWDVRGHPDTYDISKEGLLQAVKGLTHSKRIIVTNSKQPDLYNDTTLLASMPEGDHSNDFILSEKVHVVRENNELLDDPFEIAVLTIPTVVYNKDSDKPDDIRERVGNRIRDIILMAAYYGYKDLVLDISSLGFDDIDPFFIANYLSNILNKDTRAWLYYCEKIRFVIPGDDANAGYWRDAFRFVFSKQIEKSGNTEILKYEFDSDGSRHDINDYEYYIDLGKLNERHRNRLYTLVEDKIGNKRLMVRVGPDSSETLRDTSVEEKLAIRESVLSGVEKQNKGFECTNLIEEDIVEMKKLLHDGHGSFWQPVNPQPQPAS